MYIYLYKLQSIFKICSLKYAVGYLVFYVFVDWISFIFHQKTISDVVRNLSNPVAIFKTTFGFKKMYFLARKVDKITGNLNYVCTYFDYKLYCESIRESAERQDSQKNIEDFKISTAKCSNSVRDTPWVLHLSSIIDL